MAVDYTLLAIGAAAMSAVAAAPDLEFIPGLAGLRDEAWKRRRAYVVLGGALAAGLFAYLAKLEQDATAAEDKSTIRRLEENSKRAAEQAPIGAAASLLAVALQEKTIRILERRYPGASQEEALAFEEAIDRRVRERVAKIERQLEPRVLTEQQLQALTVALAAARTAPATGGVTLVNVHSDAAGGDEAKAYATQILSAFRAAGWPVHPATGMDWLSGSHAGKGVELMVSPESLKSRSGDRAVVSGSSPLPGIFKALQGNVSDFSEVVVVEQKQPLDQIMVRVYPKAPPR
jgi:hypothetical protein